MSTVIKNFQLGQTVITSNAKRQLNAEDLQAAIWRHERCDWGECSPEDVAENKLSLLEGFRLLSVYHDRNQVKFWIITEADRSVTTVMLPEDY